jgi:hypothetical protein
VVVVPLVVEELMVVNLAEQAVVAVLMFNDFLKQRV